MQPTTAALAESIGVSRRTVLRELPAVEQWMQAAGAHFVKTSTGFSTGGATTHDIALMRKTVGPEMGVKASGGIRDYETAMAMIEAGANRIGASAGIAIVAAAE